MFRVRQLFFASMVVISGAVYAITVCPTVELIDSGELALAVKNLGIAHPTGYPLYTLLGRIFSIIPIGHLIIRLNFLSLLFTALAAGFLYLLISEFILKDRRKLVYETISAAAALFVALSPVWWSQGTTNEVYSLNLLLISISIWSLAEFSKQGSVRMLLLSAYVLGLSLANHLSAVYLIPSFVYLAIVSIREFRVKSKSIARAVLFFVIPGTLYAVLPIRAHFRPFLNWGGVSDPYFFYKHITGWQYRVWMFTKPLEIFNNFGAKIGPALKLYLGQFGWIGLLFILTGIVVAALRFRKLLIFAGLICILNLIYALNYEIMDIESYYLPMFLVSGIFLALGIITVFNRLFKTFGRSNAVAWAMAGAVFILPIYNLAANFSEMDQSQKTSARQGVYDISKAMEPGGLILVENWDFYSPWLYLHFEENYRPDLVFLDKELMRRSWYIDFIERYHSDIYRRSRAEFEEFLRQVAPFERDRPFNSEVIDKAYYGMLQAVIAHESAVRPVYTNIVDDNKLIAGFKPTPNGLLIRFGEPDSFVEVPRAKFDEAYWQRQSRYDPKRIGYMLSFYGKGFDLRGRYCRYYQKLNEATYYFDLSAQVKQITMGK
jgi:hypothetical protein